MATKSSPSVSDPMLKASIPRRFGRKGRPCRRTLDPMIIVFQGFFVTRQNHTIYNRPARPSAISPPSPLSSPPAPTIALYPSVLHTIAGFIEILAFAHPGTAGPTMSFQYALRFGPRKYSWRPKAKQWSGQEVFPRGKFPRLA